MKQSIRLIMLVLTMSSCTACGFLSGLFSSNNNQSKPAQTTQPAAQPKGIQISIKNPINLSDGTRDEAQITFSQFANNLDEWTDAREKMQSSPEGCVLMELLAFELYRLNQQAGQRAVELNSTSSAASEAMRQLPEIMGVRNGGDNQYARPYIVYTYLHGSTPDNGYTPTKPLTITVRERMNSKQWSELAGGYIYTLEVYSNGYDTPWRAVQVIYQNGQYRMFGCPALYTQCKRSRV